MQQDRDDKPQAFVDWLAGLDRGAFAELRRGLAFDPPGSHPPSFPFVERFVSSAWRAEREAYYLLAGLFATVERPKERGKAAEEPAREAEPERPASLGRAVADLYLAHYPNRDPGTSIEKRFVSLLDADEEQLPHRLRQMVALLAGTDGVRLHWARLLRDLVAWGREDRLKQREWAQDFYRRIAPPPARSEPAAPTTTPEGAPR